MFFNSNKFQIIWGIIITISAVFLSLFIPLKFIFHLSTESYLYLTSLLISLIFIADIFLSISKGEKADNEKLAEQHFIINNYLNTYLIFDLIAVIPFEILFNNSPLEFLRLLKLIKVALFFSQVRQSAVQYANILKFVFLAFWIFLSMHWISCGWIAIRDSEIITDNFSGYVSALYWTVTTLTTVGYGDIVPKNNQQILYAIVVMIMGIGLYGYLIGNVAGILAKRDPSKAQYLSNLEKLTALVHFRKIPVDLQNRIKNFYRYMWKQKLGYDESSFLEGLPSGLKEELSLHLKKNSVEKIPLFKKAGENFLRDIAMHLKPVVYTPGEYVFKAGDEGNEMYFVIKGKLILYSKDGSKVIAEFKEGDFFGEIALFKNKRRSANVVAISYCDLYSLNKSSFEYVLERYTDIKKEIEKIISEREEKDIVI